MNNKPIDKNDMLFTQILLAKQLYDHGINHSNLGGAINNMIAIHNFHNTVEFILRTICDHFSVNFSGDPSFNELIGKVGEVYKREIKEELPFKQQMKNLNKERNNVQHNGTPPSNEAVAKYRVFSYEFLSEVIEKVFELDFIELSLVNMISDEKIKSLLKISDTAIKEGDKLKAIAILKKTFEWGIGYLDTILPDYKIDPIYGEGWLRELYSLIKVDHFSSLGKTSRIKNYYQKHMSEIYHDLSEPLSILAYGIDLKMYYKVNNVLSNVWVRAVGYFEDNPPYLHITKINDYEKIDLRKLSEIREEIINMLYLLENQGTKSSAWDYDGNCSFYNLLIQWDTVKKEIREKNINIQKNLE